MGLKKISITIFPAIIILLCGSFFLFKEPPINSEVQQTEKLSSERLEEELDRAVDLQNQEIKKRKGNEISKQIMKEQGLRGSRQR